MQDNKFPANVKGLIPDSFNELQANIETALEESREITVLSDKTLNEAGFYIKNFKTISKAVEIIRKDIVNPFNVQVKAVNKFFKDITALYSSEENRLLTETNTHIKKKRELEELQRAEDQKELEEAVIDEAEMFEDETVLDDIPKIEIRREGVGDTSQHLTTVRNKKWKITDFDKIPLKYLTVNEALVKEIRADFPFEVDAQPIRGIEFYFDETARIK